MRRPPSLRNSNGALQVRVRLGGKDHFINRLGRWDDPVAVARAQALSARIWSDAKAGSLDQSLKRYRVSVDSVADAVIATELPLEEVLSKAEIEVVLMDLQSKEPWFYPLFLLWLSTGLRNGEIRGLTWDCVRWGEGELLVCKTLRRDGFKTGQHSWATTKTGKERVVPLSAQLLVALKMHQLAMKELDLDHPKALMFVTPNSHGVVYDQLLGRVWKRSLKRCGLQPRRLYSQRHSFLSHALAMGNSPADLAAVGGHHVSTLLSVYAKPTGKLMLPNWQRAVG